MSARVRVKMLPGVELPRQEHPMQLYHREL